MGTGRAIEGLNDGGGVGAQAQGQPHHHLAGAHQELWVPKEMKYGPGD